MLGHYRRAAEFSLGFGLTLAITTLISTLFPATGVYETVGLHSADHPNFEPSVYNATLRELPLVRDGTVRLLDAFQLGPLLTFPSFHAVSAVLYMWALWPIRWVRGIGLLWNAVMLAATPIGGGHYFVDVFAGVAVAIASIWVIKRIGARLAPEQDRERSVSQLSTVKPLAMVVPDGDLSPQSS
ncbi:phosphatase PAP2 family protein [Bradyrhizobium sp. BR 1432]|uniref:phosphatase PAP2 family protein n=1 Tax=Bradyrhizobium sp. BR 1432 TaxID=3447966 RepID=UPI003EE47EC4